MDARSLLSRLDVPRWVRLSNRTWEAAALLAGLRVAVNDRFRAADRDRGAVKNRLADIWGTFGELVALRVLNEVCALPIRHRPIDFESSVDQADLAIDLDDGVIQLEAKAHLIEPGKSWFLVNKRARDRSRLRGATAYIPVVSALGATRARVGRPITIAQLDAWREADLALRDPAVGIALNELSRDCLDLDLSSLRTLLRPRVAAGRERLMRLVEVASGSLPAWEDRLGSLDDLPAQQLVDVLHELL